MPHPAVLIFFWACISFAMQLLHVAGLLIAGVPLLVVACSLSGMRFLALLRRTRWIMLSLLFIYAYATPGNVLWEILGQFSPTWEGLRDGLLQLCRLTFTLAGLAILLCQLPQQQLISGLHTLAYPLRYAGLPRERLAVRLALTLHYAESAMLDTTANWRTAIGNLLAAGGAPPAPRPPEGQAPDEATSQSTWLAKYASQVHPQGAALQATCNQPKAGQDRHRPGCTGLKPQQHTQAGYGGVPFTGALAEIKQHSIEFHTTPFTPRDGLLMLMGCASLALVLL